MNINFETPEETNNPEKVNKAFDELGRKNRQEIENAFGNVFEINEVVGSGTDLERNKIHIENSTNKKLVVNIDGVNYGVTLTEI